MGSHDAGYLKPYRGDSFMVMGGFFEHDERILRLHDAFMSKGLGYYADALFGGQSCAWHGGRVDYGGRSEREIEEYMHRFLPAYTERGISVRLNFSNPHVTVRELADRRSNMMLSILAEYNRGNPCPHGVITASDDLREYVRDKYPDMFMTASVLKTAYAHPGGTDDHGWYEYLAGLYDMVVVRADRCIEQDWLAGLARKEKMELIVTSDCAPDCPLRVKHYDFIIEADRAADKTAMKADYVSLLKSCAHRKRNGPTVSLTMDRVREIHDLGFRHFKIAARNMEWEAWVNRTARYMVEQGGLLLRYLDLCFPRAHGEGKASFRE